jgi:uncharacterized protein (TIGR00369 family)
MTDSTAARSRTISWEDPLPTLQRAQAMSGLEAMQAIVAGALSHPPIASLLGIRMTEAGEGRVVCVLEPGEDQYNPIGSVHGGVLSTLMDSAMSCAVHTTLPAGSGYTTLEVKANFVRPVSIRTGPLTCEGRVVHAGSRVATAECRVVDRAGKLYAHGSATCLLLGPS